MNQNYHATAPKLGIILLLLIMLQLKLHVASASPTDIIESGCNTLICPNCPVDSAPKENSEELEDFVDDYDEEFPVVHVEALGPIQHRSTKPVETTTASTTQTTTQAASERRKREFLFIPSMDEKNDEFILKENMQDIDNMLKRCCKAYNGCQCNTCEEPPKCSNNQVAMELSVGLGIPGNCCSIYECADKLQCAISKQSYWQDKCTECSCSTDLCQNRCQNDEPKRHDAWQFKNCYSEYLDQPMLHGATWFEDSYCTECTCIDGERSCIANLCAAVTCKKPKKIEGRCCPVCDDDEANNETPVLTTTTEAYLLQQNTSSTEHLTSLEVTESSTNLTNSTATLQNSSTAFTSLESDATSTENIISSSIKMLTASTTTADLNDSSSTELTTNSYNSQLNISTTNSIVNTESSFAAISVETSSIESDSLNASTLTTSATISAASSLFSVSSTTQLPESTTLSTIYSNSVATTASISTSNTTNQEEFSTTTPQQQQSLANALFGDISSIVTTSTTSAPYTDTSSTAFSTSTSSSSTSDNIITYTTSYTATTATIATTESPPVAPSASSANSFASTSFFPFLSANTAATSTSTPAAPPPLEPQPTSYRQNEAFMINSPDIIEHLFTQKNIIISAIVIAAISCFVIFIIKRNRKRKLYSSVPNSETSLVRPQSIPC